MPVNVSPSKKVQPTVAKPAKEVTKCNRKFAIGGFVHCLNEDVEPPVTAKSSKKGKAKKNQNDYRNESDNLSEEQIIDKYYMAVQGKKFNESSSKNQKMNDNSADFDKISANVNSTGRQKWKSSTQQTKSSKKIITQGKTHFKIIFTQFFIVDGPKHTIFRSSDSSSDSSSSSSDSSSESDSEVVQKTAPKAKIEVKKYSESAKMNKFYEPTKEEQLNSASYNRSYYIKVIGSFK